jgi:hypothetical protein
MAQETRLPIPIRKAAKLVGIECRRLRRDYIDSGLVRAFRMGGNSAQPRLRVYLHELQKAIEENQLYIPPNMDRRNMEKVKRAKTSELHPSLVAVVQEINARRQI